MLESCPVYSTVALFLPLDVSQNKEQVVEQWNKAHGHRRDSMDGMAAREVLAKLAERIYEVHGNMKHVSTPPRSPLLGET